MDLAKYVSPELLILIPVIYLIGVGLNKSKIKANLIPVLLGIMSAVLAGLWIFSTSAIGSGQQIAKALFGAVTQGIIIVGVAFYGNQLIKNFNKED